MGNGNSCETATGRLFKGLASLTGDGSQFTGTTHEPRKPAMFCSNCGTQLNQGARFCSGCGTPAGGTNVQQAAAPRAEGNLPLSAILSVALCLALSMVGLTSGAQAANQTGARLGAPPTQLLQDPGSAELADKVDVGSFSLGLYSCSTQSVSGANAIIACFFVLTNKQGHRDYEVEHMTRWNLHLIDNLRIDHSLVRFYLLNGRGQHQDVVNLAKGESMWFAAEFADGADDIKTARVLFRGLTSKPELRAPVEGMQ